MVFILGACSLCYGLEEDYSVLSAYFLSLRTNLVIWHDAINNFISKHSLNNNRRLSTEQLANFLLRYKQTICEMVWCQRSDTEDIENKLFANGILVINVVKDFISKRKAKAQVPIDKYKELQHPPLL